MTKNKCDCFSNYRESSFHKDEKFCKSCGRGLIEKEHVLDSFCEKCGNRKVYLYKECPVKSMPFYTFARIQSELSFNFHTSNLIETYSR